MSTAKMDTIDDLFRLVDDDAGESAGGWRTPAVALSGDDGAAASLEVASRVAGLGLVPKPADSANSGGSATAAAPFETVPTSYVLYYAAEMHGDASSSPAQISFAGGGAGGASIAPSTTATAGSVTYGSAGGLQFVVNYDKSVGTAPAAFKTGFATAVQYFTSHFTNPITITLNVGWGEVGGTKLSSGALGESQTYLNPVGYSSLLGAMAATAKSADQLTARGSLPSTGPISGANYWVSTAEAKALKLIGNNTKLDGSVGFSGGASWDFATSAPTASQYYFIGVAEHEISEVMGRLALLGTTIGSSAHSYSDLDLFRYSAAGTRSLVGGQAAYLSFDKGVTHLNNFNAVAGGDWGDWATTTGTATDAYNAFASSGKQYLVSTSDTRELNVLGYTIAA